MGIDPRFTLDIIYSNHAKSIAKITIKAIIIASESINPRLHLLVIWGRVAL